MQNKEGTHKKNKNFQTNLFWIMFTMATFASSGLEIIFLIQRDSLYFACLWAFEDKAVFRSSSIWKIPEVRRCSPTLGKWTNLLSEIAKVVCTTCSTKGCIFARDKERVRVNWLKMKLVCICLACLNMKQRIIAMQSRKISWTDYFFAGISYTKEGEIRTYTRTNLPSYFSQTTHFHLLQQLQCNVVFSQRKRVILY